MSLKNVVAVVLLGLSSIAATANSQVTSETQKQIDEHNQKAQQYLHDKRPDLAIPELQALVALDPANADARGNLGVLLYFKSDYAAACPELRAALTAKPDLYKIQALLGMCETRTGDIARARPDLETAFPHLQPAKTQAEVGRELIDNYAATGELEKAAPVLATLRAQNPSDPGLLYTAYRIYSDLAGEAMLTLSMAAPDSGQMHQVMAHEMARQDDRAGAIEQYRQALKLDPSLPGLHFELAEALNSSEGGGNAQEAEAEYKAAVAADRRDEKAEVRLGDLAARDGNVPESFAHYHRAVQLNPQDTEAAVGLAKAYVSMTQPQKALPLLEHAVETDPTSALAHFRLSALYRQMGRPADAKRELAQYQKYKDMKERLRGIYKQMRLEPSRQESTETDARH
jgi:tetratricopeptide (TPR) repeat protein